MISTGSEEGASIQNHPLTSSHVRGGSGRGTSQSGRECSSFLKGWRLCAHAQDLVMR